MISTTAKYAFSILGYLVSSAGTKTSGEQIARETGIPANYLSKVLNQLRKSGFVTAEKGWGGGFEIRPDAMGRPLRDVLESIDGVEHTRIRGCVFGVRDCDEDNPCPLHSYWVRVAETFDDMVSTGTVSDLGS